MPLDPAFWEDEPEPQKAAAKQFEDFVPPPRPQGFFGTSKTKKKPASVVIRMNEGDIWRTSLFIKDGEPVLCSIPRDFRGKRFTMNYILVVAWGIHSPREPGKAKVGWLAVGNALIDRMRELNQIHPVAAHDIQIHRAGTGGQTRYTISPLPDRLLPWKLDGEWAEIKKRLSKCLKRQP